MYVNTFLFSHQVPTSEPFITKSRTVDLLHFNHRYSKCLRWCVATSQ